MARGQTLAVVRTLLKSELRDTQETNTVLDQEYNYALASKQKDLALGWDWNFLKHDWDLSCAAGSRYLNIPTSDTRGQSVTINFERPLLVSRFHNRLYTPIAYGIRLEDYNLYEGTTRLIDPIQRWQVVTNVNEASNSNQIEVWPSPATAQVVRFSGQREVKAFASDSDTADLDDSLIAFWVAADYLTDRDSKRAVIMLKKAQDHLIKLRAGYPIKQDPIHMGYKPWRVNQQNVKLIATA